MINSIFNNVSSYSKNMFSSQAKKKTETAEKTNTQNTNTMSKKAEEYLEKLKKKYKNIDFYVEQFSDSDTSKYRRGGAGEYSCIITPDLLEQMANDETVAAKYESLIDEGTSQLEELKSNVANFEFADMVDKYGFEIKEDGQINYYALLKQGLPQNAEKEPEAESENTEKADEGYFKTSNTGKIPLAKASSTDELFKIIEQASRGMFGSSVEFLPNNGNNIFNPHYSFKA